MGSKGSTMRYVLCAVLVVCLLSYGCAGTRPPQSTNAGLTVRQPVPVNDKLDRASLGLHSTIFHDRALDRARRFGPDASGANLVASVSGQEIRRFQRVLYDSCFVPLTDDDHRLLVFVAELDGQALLLPAEGHWQVTRDSSLWEADTAFAVRYTVDDHLCPLIVPVTAGQEQYLRLNSPDFLENMMRDWRSAEYSLFGFGDDATTITLFLRITETATNGQRWDPAKPDSASITVQIVSPP